MGSPSPLASSEVEGAKFGLGQGSLNKPTSKRHTGPCAIYLHADELMRQALTEGLFFARELGVK